MSENTTFSEKVMPHSRKMFAVAYHILHRADEAEDVVQDVMVKLWEMRDKLPPDKQFEPYLLVMTRNLCIDRIRSRHEMVEYDGQYPTTATGTETAEVMADETSDTIEGKNRLQVTLHLMKQLPPDQMRVLKLKVFDELQNDQIARLLNTNEDNVRQLLSRARRKLKELAIKNGVI